MATKLAGIYQIRNIVNDKRYVGSSTEIQRRWNDHRNSLNKQIHHTKRLQSAWNEFGQENFIFEIVEIIYEITYFDKITVDMKSKIRDREQIYINQYDFTNDLYNSTKKVLPIPVNPTLIEIDKMKYKNMRIAEVRRRLKKGETIAKIMKGMQIKGETVSKQKAIMGLTRDITSNKKRKKARDMLLNGISKFKILKAISIHGRYVDQIIKDMVSEGILEKVGQRYLPVDKLKPTDQNQNLPTSIKLVKAREMLLSGLLRADVIRQLYLCTELTNNLVSQLISDNILVKDGKRYLRTLYSHITSNEIEKWREYRNRDDVVIARDNIRVKYEVSTIYNSDILYQMRSAYLEKGLMPLVLMFCWINKIALKDGKLIILLPISSSIEADFNRYISEIKLMINDKKFEEADLHIKCLNMFVINFVVGHLGPVDVENPTDFQRYVLELDYKAVSINKSENGVP